MSFFEFGLSFPSSMVSALRTGMKFLRNASAMVALVLCSCADYPYRASYELDESYSSAKPKLDRYYENQEKDFSLFHDQVRFSHNEKRPSSETVYLLRKWAPDIGTQLLHESTLANSGQASGTFEVNAQPIARHGSSTESRVKGIDEWVVNNLKVKRREIGELRPSEVKPKP